MVCSGLYCIIRDKPHPFPLRRTRIDASLYDLCAEVTLQQTFVNDSPPPSLPLECFYTFPLHEESAVFSFVCDLDGVVSRGKIKEKTQARAEYDSAVRKNECAMLLEQSADNVFQCRVGSLRPGSVCTITITYLTLLDQEGRSNRFTLPMIVAPKYTPLLQGPTPPFPVTTNTRVHSGFQCEHCLPIIGTRHQCTVCSNYNLCDGCKMQPGLHDADHTMLALTDPSTGNNDAKVYEHPPVQRAGSGQPAAIEGEIRDLTINMAVRMPSPIVSIRCPSHAEETCIQQAPGSEESSTVSFHSNSSSSLSCDFILLVEQQRCFDPRVLCELDLAKRTAAISLAFVPPALDMLSASQLRCELIFLLDCSGSMYGPSISCVRDCMHILLRSLPVHSRFNIIVFGSSWSSLFSNSQVYDDKSLSAATEYVARLQADLGGTEIYRPLHHALTSSLLDTHPRQIFLLTDGQVTNVQQLVQLTSQHAANIRLFTFGIGTAVDRSLCKKLAQAGRGKCEFVTATDAQGGDMREKVVRQVTRAMQPVLTDVRVNWKELNRNGSSVEGSVNSISAANEGATSVSSSRTSFLQCPSVAPAIFMNSRYILHALNATLPDTVWKQVETGEQPSLQIEIEITARSNHPLEAGCMHKTVRLTGQQITQAGVIHTLAARARIRELEDRSIPQSNEDAKKDEENEILQLGLQHSVTSSRTSFVVVYDTGKEEEVLQSSEDDLKGIYGLFNSFRPRSRTMFFQATASPVASFGCSGPVASFGSSRPDACSGPVESFGCSRPVASFGCSGTVESFGSSRPAASFGYSRPASNILGPGSSPLVAELGLFAEVESVREQSHFCCDQVDFFRAPESLEMPKQEASNDEPVTFEDLIKLQSATGVWNLTPMLMKIVHSIQPSSTVTLEFLQAICGKYGVDQQVVAVLFVLILLETKYKQRQTEWQMLATKARYFVTNHAQITEKLQDEIKAEIQKQMAPTPDCCSVAPS